MKTNLAALAVFLGSIGWGLTWIPLKFLTDSGLHSSYLVLIAFTAGAIVLLPWLIREYPSWKAHLRLMLAIALAGGISNASFQTAMAHGDVVRVMILFYMLPVWSVLGGRLFLGEAIDRSRLIAVALCLCGGALILDVFNVAWQGVNWIDMLALLSGMGLASTNILFRYSAHISLIAKIVFMFVGCILLMCLSLRVLPVTSMLPGLGIIGLAVAYGALGLTLITVGTQWGVTQIEAGRASVIIVTELFVAVFSASVILSLTLKSAEILGGIMVLGAAFIEGLRKADPTELKSSKQN